MLNLNSKNFSIPENWRKKITFNGQYYVDSTKQFRIRSKRLLKNVDHLTTVLSKQGWYPYFFTILCYDESSNKIRTQFKNKTSLKEAWQGLDEQLTELQELPSSIDWVEGILFSVETHRVK